MSHNITGNRRRANGFFLQHLEGTLDHLIKLQDIREMDNVQDDAFDRLVFEFSVASRALVIEIEKDGIETL